jgi:hypothetical protein
MNEQNPANGTEQGRRQLAHEHVEASEPCPQPPKGGSKGSIGYRNQNGHTRMVGSDPLVKHQVKQRSKVKPKEPSSEPDTLRPTGWRELRGRP